MKRASIRTIKSRSEYFNKELERCDRLFTKLCETGHPQTPAKSSGFPHNARHNLRQNNLRSHTLASFPSHKTQSRIFDENTVSSYCLDTVYLNRSPDRKLPKTPSVWTSASKSAPTSNNEKHTVGSRDRNKKISPEELCRVLVRHGLGDPREAAQRHKDRRQREYEERQVLFKKRIQRKKNMKNVNYYIEKLKGQALIDSYTANSKAEAFCEQQHGRCLRTISANRLHRFHEQVIEDAFSRGSTCIDETGGTGLDDKPEEGEDERKAARKELFKRIMAWMEDCDQAIGTNGPTNSRNESRNKASARDVAIINRDIEVKRKIVKNISTLPVI